MAINPNNSSQLHNGAPLPDDVQENMGKAFGRDFSQVRVHSNASAAATGGAKAHTIGQNILFAPGQYAPGSSHGNKLIAHELTHVAQQGGNGMQKPETIAKAEQELSAHSVAGGGAAAVKGPSEPSRFKRAMNKARDAARNLRNR